MESTRLLAEHFASLSLSQVPERVVADVKRLVLDWLGVAIRGSTTETGRIVADYVKDMGGKREATIIGSGVKAPSASVAFVNGVQSANLELDDADHQALFMHGPPVVSAALAAAEKVEADGKSFLTGVVAGCEAISRISDSVNISHRDRGFHTTATCGSFGAAVAAGKVLNLGVSEMVSCLGLAGAQASGLMEFYGVSMQKRIDPGLAARNGVTAALLAQMEFTGSETILEGPRGFCKAFSDKYDLDKLSHGLGSEFPIYIEFKPYACARPIHAAIDCVLSISKQHRADVGKIDVILVRRHPSWANFHLIYAPRSYHEAQVSLPYSVAISLIDGKALLEQYSETRIKDPQVLDLAKKVKVLPDNSLVCPLSVAVKIRMSDGTEYEQLCDHPKGSIENPLTNEELKIKFEYLASPIVDLKTIRRIVEKVDDVEHVKVMSELSCLIKEKDVFHSEETALAQKVDRV